MLRFLADSGFCPYGGIKLPSYSGSLGEICDENSADNRRGEQRSIDVAWNGCGVRF